MIDVTAAIIRDHDRFLICQRPEGSTCAMMWEFPGGKFEPGETGEACVVRECMEELDLSLRVERKLTETTVVYPEKSFRIHFYVCGILSGEPVLKEHHACQWIRPSEADRFNFCPADREMLSSPAWRTFVTEGFSE